MNAPLRRPAARSREGDLPDYVQAGFDKLDADLRFLVGCFAEVLQELGQPELATLLPWLGHQPSAEELKRFPDRLDQTYSIAFQLLNMVEEIASAQVRRTRETEEGLVAERGLWGHALQRLRAGGYAEAEIAEALPHVRIEPVLTAHPTEAKRLAVLEQHRLLYGLLERRENPTLTPSEQQTIRDEIKAALERLWRTGEILLTRPEVADERRNITHYLREVFPAVLPKLDERLEQAWQASGFDAANLSSSTRLPRLCFGTWVGGDRDGHPLVTPAVTAETIERLRLNALIVLHRKLSILAERLSLSAWMQPPPEPLRAALARLGVPSPNEEPWRQFATLMLERLPVDIAPDKTATMRTSDGVYRAPDELMGDLEILHGSLTAVGAERLAHSDVVPVMRALDVFGFHLAQLDIRQNSQFHDKALAQLMVASGLAGADYSSWPEERRREFAEAELRSPRPFLHPGTAVGEEADSVLGCYRVLAAHMARFGSAGIGALIVSMTRDLSDLLNVYLLAREAGLTEFGPEGLTCGLRVVPLFETLDDLQRSAPILREFVEHPVTRRSLEARRRAGEPLVQQVMIGYSDSNKDAGILASQWALQRAQERMIDVGRECGVLIRFFHGRGGTSSRGAGPTHRFLEALPRGSLAGDLRLTEQGEIIAQKYGNLTTAAYNLELLIAGTTATTLLQTRAEPAPASDAPLEAIAEQLATASERAYRQLLETDGFLAFFREATPIDALESSRIGSRPARRTGQHSLADLRAIPWVFGWTQARFYLPGWYGVGTALAELERNNAPGFQKLVAGMHDSPLLRYVLTNVETNIASTDFDLMHAYSALVGDTAIRERIFGLIAEEWHRTVAQLDRLRGERVDQRRPRMALTLKLRADALRALHLLQIDILRRWRELRAANDFARADEILPGLLLSINAIASGLRTTG